MAACLPPEMFKSGDVSGRRRKLSEAGPQPHQPTLLHATLSHSLLHAHRDSVQRRGRVWYLACRTHFLFALPRSLLRNRTSWKATCGAVSTAVTQTDVTEHLDVTEHPRRAPEPKHSRQSTAGSVYLGVSRSAHCARTCADPANGDCHLFVWTWLDSRRGRRPW